ncbi:hypothetical protein [Frigoriglobus tundricola]|uniref:Uncharacterized protein n=1 Tax=Frigoriglobus tundricola TaxID=2774151 RepID=A0A6M5YTP7_9BACT|nr:hypothetical protein [Frigoriglobus tundricola]QJW96814.1 hypothetical protein FTUN_4373 [Frigoriglobus tundricola]
MSEVVWDFIEPYKDHWKTGDQLKKLVSVALIARNAAIASPRERADLLDRTAATLPPDARDDFLAVMMDLIKRKTTYFAANKRMIIDYQLTMTSDGPHLSVISTLER